jgi:flagellar M-ring protein FliF
MPDAQASSSNGSNYIEGLDNRSREANITSASLMKSRIMLGVGAAALIAVIAASVMWSSQPDFKVLFSNLSDKDGGAIVAQLSQMNIPYRHSDGGNAILVPGDKVHDARLKLASQGLPRGGNVGFEVLENQKFGLTQFQEQVHYQRALEGELSRSIQSLSAVQGARVHLALPKQSVFIREQQKPSASVLLTLHAGRSLDRTQIAGIAHLVSSSVADLPVKHVSILDQAGSLLSASTDTNNASGLDPSQLNHVRELEDNLSRRIIDLLEPVVGRSSVRAQVTADLDFTQTESTAETYTPNQGPDAKTSIRSQTTSEASNAAGPTSGGVPGALSNLPAQAPSSPITNAPGAGQATGANGSNGRREALTNYELDKTVKRTRNQTGTVKRITAAILVNHKKTTGEDGKVTYTPLSEAETSQLQSLVQEAIGYNKERGDSINLVNAPFSQDAVTALPETVWWKDPWNISMAKEIGKGVGFLVAILVIVFGVIRPALKAATLRSHVVAPPLQLQATSGPSVPALPAPAASDASLTRVKDIAKNDPAVVANVVRQWVGSNG